MKLYFLLISHWQKANSTEFIWQQRKLRFQLSFSPEECKEIDHSCLEFFAGASIEFRYAGCGDERA